MWAAGAPRNTETVQRFYEYSLLGMLASGCLAIAGSGYLAPVPLLLTCAALIVRALMATGIISFRLPPRAITALTLLYVAFYPVDYFYISHSFLPSTVHLIFFLVITKILTASTSRDYFYVKIIALVELLAACLLSANSNFFLFLGLFLLFTVAALASGEIRASLLRRGETGTEGIVVAHQRFRGNSLVLFAVSVSAGILVLTAGLFFLLPRTARAAMQHLIPSRYHLAGFSNQVDLGEIGEIQQQDTPVMHIQPENGAPFPPFVKWRGAALAEFDGRRWFNPPGMQQIIDPEKGSLYILASPDDRRRQVERFTYVVHLSDISGNALFFAGRPEFVWIDAPFLVQTSPGLFGRQFAASGPVTYRARSFVDTGSQSSTETANGDDTVLTAAYLQLPVLDPRLPELARTITRGLTGSMERSRAIEGYLRRNYGYTLTLPATEPRDPLANFLFNRRKGHCEYFASSMAVMVRTLGIPSRVVTGFQSGVFNPVSGQQLIRASDAHSWVEVWIPNRGWTVFDPTPPDYSLHRPSLFSQLSLYLDAAEVFWQEWVLNYSLDHQLVLAARMEDSGRRFRTSWPEKAGAWISLAGTRIASAVTRWKWLLLPGVLFAVLAGLFGNGSWRFLRARIRFQRAMHSRSTPSDATVLYQRLLRLLHKRGLEKPPWLTPAEFAGMVRDPELAQLARDITDAYNEVRFGGRADGAARMVQLLSRLES